MFNLEDYETVEERLIKFWKDHPDGQIHTQIVEASASRFIVIASIYRTEADPRPWTTGLAEETVQGRGVNATSALENCETSAIGRGLANAGYATKGKRASREEMSKVASGEAAKTAIAQAKAKMAQTAAEYVPVAKEDDPWTIREAEPATTVDEAVAMVKEIIGGQTDRDIPKCTKCDPPKEMSWKTGQGKNGKPYGKMDCFVCKDIIWYEVDKESGVWVPQKAKW
jgi:hypothetical protein